MPTTLLLALAFTLLTDETEQLQTSIRIKSDISFPATVSIIEPTGARVVPRTIDEDLQLFASCDVFPKTLTVGDMIYVRVVVKSHFPATFEYTLSQFNDLSEHNFISSVGIRSMGTEVGDSVKIRELPSPSELAAMAAPPASSRHLVQKRKWQPGDSLTLGVQPFLMPSPDDYDKRVWAWVDSDREEYMLLNFDTARLGTLRTEEKESSVVARTTSNVFHITQQLIVKPRPEAELQLIREWYDKTGKFKKLWGTDSPNPAEWRKFEDKLTPGTLRNHVRMLRTLVEIVQDENKGKRQEMFNDLLKWIDELHPLEREGLAKQTYKIVKEKRQIFSNEITGPQSLSGAESVGFEGKNGKD